MPPNEDDVFRGVFLPKPILDKLFGDKRSVDMTDLLLLIHISRTTCHGRHGCTDTNKTLGTVVGRDSGTIRRHLRHLEGLGLVAAFWPLDTEGGPRHLEVAYERAGIAGNYTTNPPK